MKLTLLALTLLWLLACGVPDATLPPFKVAHVPPSPKDIIDAAMASASVPLSDPSCATASTELTDKTVGRYLAGFLAELADQQASNAITTSVQERTEAGEQVYACRLMVRHAQGEDVWSWGIEFAVRQDGSMIRNSFRCVGAG